MYKDYGSYVAWWIGIILLTKEQLVDLGHWNPKDNNCQSLSFLGGKN